MTIQNYDHEIEVRKKFKLSILSLLNLEEAKFKCLDRELVAELITNNFDYYKELRKKVERKKMTIQNYDQEIEE